MPLPGLNRNLFNVLHAPATTPAPSTVVPAILLRMLENAMCDKVAMPKAAQKARIVKSKEVNAKESAQSKAVKDLKNNFQSSGHCSS